MAAWRSFSWPPLVITSVGHGFEGLGKCRIDHELGEVYPHTMPVKKKRRVGSRLSSLSLFKARSFGFFSRRSMSTAGYVAVGEAKEKKKKKKPLRRLERRPKTFSAGDDHLAVGGFEVHKNQPLPQLELEQSPACLLTQLRLDNNSGCSIFRSRMRSLFEWSTTLLVSCSCCMSRHPRSTSDGRIDDNETNLDDVTIDPLSVIWLKGGNHVDDGSSNFGNQIGADDPADFISTALKRIHVSATMGVVESASLSAEFRPAVCGAAAEECITFNLGGPGEPTVALGGLSLASYERIVFAVCPALPADSLLNFE